MLLIEIFEISVRDISLRTQTFRDDKQLGSPLLIPRNELEKRTNE